MAKTYLEPSNDMVLLVDMPRTTTLDGITMPDNMREQEMVFGTIVAVGPLVNHNYTKPEDRVCYGPFAGKTVAIDGIEFRLMKEGQIEGHLQERSE